MTDKLSLILRASTIAFLFVLASAAMAGNDQWSSAGPFGGGILDFAFHPQSRKLVFASEFNGIYRSTNAGRSWRFLLSFAHPLIGIPRSNPKILIAIDFNNEVVHSRDVGKTFEKVPSNLASITDLSLDDLELDPEDPETLYVVGNFARVFLKSTDGGRTWSRKQSGLKLNDFTVSSARIQIDSTNRNILYVSSGKNLFKSNDAAESWKLIHSFSSAISGFVINPKKPLILYAITGTDIFKTTNGGSRWAGKNCQCTDSSTSGINPIALDASAPDVIYAVDFRNGGVVKSTNAGARWKHIAISNISPPLAVNPISGANLLGRSSVGILQSKNAGESWVDAIKGLAGITVRRVQLGPDGKVFALGGLGTFGTDVFVNVANRWKPLVLPDALSSVFDLDVHPKNPNLVFILGAGNGAIGISNDGGVNWFVKNSVPDPVSTGSLALDPQNESVIYLGYANGQGVAKSTDSGDTFQFTSAGLPDTEDSVVPEVVVDPSNSSIVFAGTSKGVFFSSNGGANWSKPKTSPKNFVRSIAIDPHNSKIAYAVSSTFASVLFKTDDGGKSWINTGRGLPEMAGSVVRVDPAHLNTVYVAGSAGVFVSTNGAKSFTTFDSNGIAVQDFLQPFQGSFGSVDLALDPGGSTLQLGIPHGVFFFSRTALSAEPEIVQISPASGQTGNMVTINGDHFGPVQRNNKVFFGTLDAGTAQKWSDSSIQIRVPPGAPTGPVIVRIASRNSNPFSFIVTTPEGTINPASGPSAGGTVVSFIAPSPFSVGQLFTVLFGETIAPGDSVQFIAPNTIVCKTPTGEGTVEVFIATTAASAKVGTFTYE